MTGETSVMRNKKIVRLFLTAGFCSGLLTNLPFLAAGIEPLDATAQDQPERPVLWSEPEDLERRDLFYGIGGKSGAPDASQPFLFVKRSGSYIDSSEKFEVRDQQGRQWVVKLGEESRAEVAATRLVWAVGYHVDQDYFVHKAEVKGRGDFAVQNARFERDDDGYEKVGRWSWQANPFQENRELQGLKVLMALLNNWDISEANNKIVRLAGRRTPPREHIYYVNDLGASLGSTGSLLNRLPMYADTAVPHSIADVEAFARHPFVEQVRNGQVVFHWQRKFGKAILTGVRVENARWMGNLLGRLSDGQLTEAFRAGGFRDSEVALYVSAVRKRIKQLQDL